MAQRVGGFRRKTRSKLKRSPREHGKISLTRYFQQLESGDRVNLNINPSVHRGMFFPRFHGKTGVVTGKRGSCYEVAIKDGNKEKIVIAHPIHLRKA